MVETDKPGLPATPEESPSPGRYNFRRETYQSENMESILTFVSNSMKNKRTFDPELVESDDEAGPFSRVLLDEMESMRLRTAYFMEQSFFGFLYFYFFMALSVSSALIFICTTYENIYRFEDKFSNALDIIEYVVTSLFLGDWCLSLFIAQNKLQFLFSFFSIVDLLTVVSVFSVIGVTCPSYPSIDSFGSATYYVICGLGTTRILRALRIRKQLVHVEDEVKRFTYDMILTIVVMILFNSAVMQYLERQEPGNDLPFNTWMYYMVITITTVGYGDITPHSELGRIYCMAMVSFAIILVPKMTNELIDLINKESVYHRAHYKPKSKATYHIVVCGDLKSSDVREFFQELFHEDHDTKHLHAVILHPEYPTGSMLRVLNDKKIGMHVTYLEGNPLVTSDLHRAMVCDARAIFIMTNNFSPRPDEVDAKAILQQFCIMKYLRLNSSQSRLNQTFFCMQLIRPENKRHLVTQNGLKDDRNVVVCLNEIKMGIISKTVCYPGTNTLLMNLCSSFADEEEEDQDPALKAKANKENIEAVDEFEVGDWIGEYSRGCDWEIYTTELSNMFEGSSFCKLSEMLYNKLGIVLFALELNATKDTGCREDNSKILLNPADFIIPPRSAMIVQAYVIAKNKRQSDLTFQMKEDDKVNPGAMNFSHLALLTSGLGTGIPSILPGIGKAKQVHSEQESKSSDEGKQAWQQLLLNQKNLQMSESQQEELQRREDFFLKENFYVRGAFCELPNATIKTSVSEEMPFIENHIMIIGKSLSNLYDLIRPLRSKHIGGLRHIVIMSPYELSPSVWQRISIFESVWFIRGSALEEADIRRAGIFKAIQVVVLADSADSSLSNANSSTEQDAIIDADAIFSYQCVRRMNEKINVVVEIVKHTNVAYLDPEAGTHSNEVNYKFTPQFAAGTLFATSLLDTLVCQAYFNPKIIRVLQELISSVENGGVSEKKQKGSKNVNGRYRRNSMSGSGQTSPLKKAVSEIVGSSLYQISINDIEGMESRTYGALYRTLANTGQIPLGLLRGIYSSTRAGPKSNKLPYVFTNPPKETELFTCDKVFVLGQKVMYDKFLNKQKTGNSKEANIYSQLRKYRSKTADDVLEMTAAVLAEVRGIKEGAHAKLHEKLDSFIAAQEQNQKTTQRSIEKIQIQLDTLLNPNEYEDLKDQPSHSHSHHNNHLRRADSAGNRPRADSAGNRPRADSAGNRPRPISATWRPKLQHAGTAKSSRPLSSNPMRSNKPFAGAGGGREGGRAIRC